MIMSCYLSVWLLLSAISSSLSYLPYSAHRQSFSRYLNKWIDGPIPRYCILNCAVKDSIDNSVKKAAIKDEVESLYNYDMRHLSFLDLYDLLRKGESVNVVFSMYQAYRINLNMNLSKELSGYSKYEYENFLYVINKFENADYDIYPDTIHILVTGLFKTRRQGQGIKLFNHFFYDRKILPNTRSFNIMIENARINNNITSALYFLDEFKTFNLQPDNYTVSSLIRMANTVNDVMVLMNKSNLQLVLTPPVIRCAIETLGKLRAIPEIFQITLTYLQNDENIFSSPKSGDALIVALIQSDNGYENCIYDCAVHESTGLDLALSLCMPPTLPINTSQTDSIDIATMSDGTTATSRIQLFQEYDIQLSSYINTMSEPFQTDLRKALMNSTIVYSGKGLCALFTGLQREIRSLQYTIVMRKIKNEDYTLYINRWKYLQQASLYFQEKLYTSDLVSEILPLFNGRLCDAILRTYMHDMNLAKSVWMKSLLPLAQKCDKLSPGVLLEVAEKALDAMMFIAGFHNRADIGLEIAKTARSRKLPKIIMTKLAKSYSRGKIEKFYLLNPKESDYIPKITESESEEWIDQSAVDTDSQRNLKNKSQMNSTTSTTTTTAGDMKKSTNPSSSSSSSSSTTNVVTGINNWNDLLNIGLERSIESELGILLETNINREFPIKNIRLQFANIAGSGSSGSGAMKMKKNNSTSST